MTRFSVPQTYTCRSSGWLQVYLVPSWFYEEQLFCVYVKYKHRRMLITIVGTCFS